MILNYVLSPKAMLQKIHKLFSSLQVIYVESLGLFEILILPWCQQSLENGEFREVHGTFANEPNDDEREKLRWAHNLDSLDSNCSWLWRNLDKDMAHSSFGFFWLWLQHSQKYHHRFCIFFMLQHMSSYFNHMIEV